MQGNISTETEIEKLRSEILVLRRNSGARIIGFTSAQREEGTSTIVANLALALKHTDLRVLLVDLNVKNPRLSEHFSLSNDLGLIDVVRGHRSLMDVTQTITPGRISLLPLGHLQDAEIYNCLNAACYFSSAAKNTQNCDLILLDLPPFNECFQAIQVAQKIDGIIQVVQTERTRAEVAKSIKAEMDRLGVRVFGSVLNGRKFYIPKTIYKHI